MDEKENTVKNKGHKRNMALKQIVKQPNGQKEATEASLKPEVIEKRSVTNRVNSAIRKEITPLMTEYIRERIFSPVGENGEPYFKAYVDTFLADALEDPSGRCSQQISSGIFNEVLFRNLDSLVADQEKAEEKAEFLQYKILKTLYKEQRQVYEDPSRYKMCICSRRVGKCWSGDTLLRKYDGTIVRADEVKTGDVLIDENSNPTSVVNTTSGEDEMFLIESNKPSISFKCNSKHILTLIRTKKPAKRALGKEYEVGKIYDIPLDTFLKFSKHLQESFSLFRAKTEYAKKEHLIDPYILGLWLGDGIERQPTITIDRRETEEIDEIYKYATKMGFNITVRKEHDSNASTYRICAGTNILNEFRRLNLLLNKHIPQEYKVDSIENRLQLLAGLIDTDGYVPKRKKGCMVEFCNTNKTLIDDVLEIANSLGFRTSVRTKIPKLYGKECSRCWIVTIKGELSKIPTRIPRKRMVDSIQKPYYSFNVKSIGKGKYYGFTLSGNGRCLLADYTVTHNTELAARMLLADALVPNHHGLYIAPLFEQAIGIGMKKVMSIADELKIEYKPSKIEGKISFSNGSDIVFKGNSKRGEADKYQGYLYSFCIVDEVQSQVCLDYLLNSILGAAMVDIKGSKQLLIGTPPRIPNTYCEKLWNMKNNVYSKYNWNMFKNPFLQNDVETEIEIACKKAGVSKDSTFIQREYYGKFAYDTEALIFKNYKTYEELPENFMPTKIWIGVDWGFVDDNAITITAVDYYSKNAYVIDSKSFGHVDTDEQERAVTEAYYKALDFLKKYNIPDREHKVTIVTDTNQPATILKLQRAGLPVIPAYKPDVLSTVEQLATEMRTRLYIKPGSVLEEECTKTLWKRDDDGRILGEIDDKTFHPNAIHALRYCMIQWLDEWNNYQPGHIQEISDDDGPLSKYTTTEENGYEVIGYEEI